MKMALINSTLLLQQWVEAFNRGDSTCAQQLCAPNAVLEEIGTERALHKEEIPALFQAWRSAFPDAICTVTKAVASRNHIAAEIVWRGTHLGEFMGKSATHRKMMVQAALFLTAEGNAIKHLKHYVDIAGMMKQLERSTT